ncbi:MAG: DUF1223 domain-containing protein [Pseudomonadota bacterium]
MRYELLFVGAGLALVSSPVFGQESVPFVPSSTSGVTQVGAAQANDAQVKPRTVVVEMFLSQACKKSPPAAKVLSKISASQNVVALAWHVDYWNDMPSSEGGWVDPFSAGAYSARQKVYNKRIRNRSTVFTPQAVIDGKVSVIGSSEGRVRKRIEQAAETPIEAKRPSMELVRRQDDDPKIIRVRVNFDQGAYDVNVIDFRPVSKTEIFAGDNAGHMFEEVNVVSGIRQLAADGFGEREVAFSTPDEGLGCAVIIQQPDQGAILDAAYCDSARAEPVLQAAQ